MLIDPRIPIIQYRDGARRVFTDQADIACTKREIPRGVRWGDTHFMHSRGRGWGGGSWTDVILITPYNVSAVCSASGYYISSRSK